NLIAIEQLEIVGGRSRGQAVGQQKVAAVARLDLDDVALLAEMRHVFDQHELHAAVLAFEHLLALLDFLFRRRLRACLGIRFSAALSFRFRGWSFGHVSRPLSQSTKTESLRCRRWAPGRRHLHRRHMRLEPATNCQYAAGGRRLVARRRETEYSRSRP